MARGQRLHRIEAAQRRVTVGDLAERSSRLIRAAIEAAGVPDD